MGRCIFCGKQTGNEYSYYAPDGSDGREKITACACTKCMTKKGVTALLIVSGLFLVSVVGNTVQMMLGTIPMEVGPLVSSSVMMAVLSAWTAYKIYCIRTDKPLSEKSGAKKFIRKARKYVFEKLTPDMFGRVEFDETAWAALKEALPKQRRNTTVLSIVGGAMFVTSIVLAATVGGVPVIPCWLVYLVLLASLRVRKWIRQSNYAQKALGITRNEFYAAVRKLKKQYGYIDN